MDALADRNLLFGLLALQTGMIEQAALVVAFNTWARAKSRSLAEILLDQGAIDADDRDALAGMAARHLKRHGGDPGKSLAAVPAGPSTRARLATLGDDDLATALPFVGTGSDLDDPYRTASRDIGGPTSGAGRFRILRPHARGGLGEVFVAVDGELNREVALKQILERHADDEGSRVRFLLEAEITGGLEHPGIVPVYGLGSDGDGRPYYAMRFIRGDSLKEAIAAFHSDETSKKDPGKRSLAFRKLLRRFVDVCNAIDYAHGRGVLHRDIKPANIIVGMHGETLVVDWGLAKAMGPTGPRSVGDERTLRPTSSGGPAETLPGLALGTPSYMSPEQSTGDLDRLGPRSDVYSLGATLYSLLTGRAPFVGDDLGGVLRAVQKGSFPPPRQVDPAIDRALEAVCLKAMATEPADRHATARALADDVERWAADELTSAWVEPFSARARRWMRHNRSAVTAIGAAALVTLVGLSAVLAVQSRANEVLKAKNVELDRANAREAAANAGLRESNARVQARFELAREAIRSFQQGVTEDDMLKGRELKGLRDKLLRNAAGFYEKLEALLRGQGDRASRAILAQSYFELGGLTEQIGIHPEAVAVQRQGLAIRRELAAGPEADAGSKLDLARSLFALGLLAEKAGDTAGSLAAAEEARTLAGPLAEGPGSTEAARDILGTSHHRIGRVLEITGQPNEALEAHLLALAIRRKLAEDNPAVAEYRGSLATSHNNIGLLQMKAGRWAEPLESYRAALAIFSKLAEDNPAVAEYRNGLAISHFGIGFVRSRTGEPSQALHSHRLALAIRRKLAEDNPASTEFGMNLAISLNFIGWLQTKAGVPAEALQSHLGAVAILTKLAEDNPTVTEFGASLADCHVNIGLLQAQAGEPAKALDSHRRAMVIYRELAGDNPTVADFRNRLADRHDEIGVLQSEAGHPAEALATHRHALAIREELARDNPTVWAYQRNLAVSLHGIGQSRLLHSDLAGAIVEYRRAVAILERLPRTAENFYDLACLRSLLAGACARPRSGVRQDDGDAVALAAVSALGQAIRSGYRDLAHMRADSDLDPLRARPDFRLLMIDLAFPADVFAR